MLSIYLVCYLVLSYLFKQIFIDSKVWELKSILKIDFNPFDLMLLEPIYITNINFFNFI